MPELQTIQHLAGTAICHIRCHAALNGGWLASLDPQSPEWIPELLRRVHDQLEYSVPDAHIYAFTVDACNAIAQAHNGTLWAATNLIQAEIPPPPVVLTRWLADDPERRAQLCDREQLGQNHADLILTELLACGYQRERLAVLALVYQLLAAVAQENARA